MSKDPKNEEKEDKETPAERVVREIKDDVAVEATVDLDNILNPAVQPAIQVQPTLVVFVPQEDFELRVNKDVIDCKKGVPQKMTLDQAQICLDANKGYVRD